MKIVNLDKIVTKRERVIILNSKEHVMHVPTVQDYIEQMKKADEIQSLANVETPSIDTARQVLELTIQTLMKSFPTITEDEFRSLNMDQLNALREFSDDTANADAVSGEGEDQGKAD